MPGDPAGFLRNVDVGGHKIGSLEAVYVDTSTDEPTMATVQVGLPTRHCLVFVSRDGVIAGPGYVKVNYAKSLVKGSPAIGMDDVLPFEDEEAVFKPDFSGEGRRVALEPHQQDPGRRHHRPALRRVRR